MLLQEVANRFSDSNREVNADTELRFLPDHARLRLTTVLDAGNGWREVLHRITHPDYSDRPLFNPDHARVLENYTRGSRSDEILKTWSTTGRNRPKISDLIALLKQAELHRAASIIENDVLQQAPRNDDDNLDELSDLGPPPAPPSENYHDEVLDSVINETPRFWYDDLARATGNFCDRPLSLGGFKIGEGAFGVVYKGTFPDGTAVAVKRMKDSLPEQFLTEVRLLRRYSHRNLLPLIGISLDGAASCLVYEFMEMGCLQSCLARKDNPMYWKRRVTILKEVAAAINFLHTCTPCLIHRDVKSANILLDRNYTAKLGDFGLTRQMSGDSTTRTEIVVGTSVYMSPEAFTGTISPKMDTFSFGVVIMEVLTGLPPYTNARGDILSYLKDTYPNDITPVLDTSAGVWDQEMARKVYELGDSCVRLERRQRPTMEPIYEELVKLNDMLNGPMD